MRSKFIPWTLASLLATTALFGDDTIPKPKPKTVEQVRKGQNQMMAGYNSPSRIDVRGSWDIYAWGSFIYWQMSQDNMEVAFADSLSLDNYLTNNQVKGNYVAMDFSYLPGFKAGFGLNCDHDNWDARAEYTMLHGTSSAQSNGVVVNSQTSEVGPLFPTFGTPTIEGSNLYNSASENWRSNLDIIDINLGRAYYTGTALIFRPAFGARAAWILQNIHANYQNDSFTPATNPQGAVLTPGMLDVYERSHCWSLGPRATLNTDWIIGRGIRFFGNAGGDILYTKYKLQTKTNFVSSTTGESQFMVGREILSVLRTHLDLDLGLGWGSYFDNNNWHIDLSAAYGFQVFFDQMLPKALGASQEFTAPGNLYAQGMTATVRFDF